jgi:muramoyltetrapeptide carboxypeptidase
VGYSDITVLHLALYARAQWSGLSGPVVTEWETADDATLRSAQEWSAGTGALAIGSGFEEKLSTLTPGAATGPLLGGNLAVLTRLLGTPYAPDFEGALLFLEEVAEAPYRVDRMLAHLQHAGVLDAVAGVVLGDFSPGDLDSASPTLSLETVFHDYFADRPYPVVQGLPYGHRLPRCSVPIGVPATLRATSTDVSLTAHTPIVEME